MATDPVLEILEHYGIKGMHWGTRRSRGANGRVTGRSKPRSSTDFKTTAPLRKRPSHSLTNMQLKKVNERMQLENKFHQMNPTRKQKGKAFANDMLKAGVGVGGAAAAVKIATNPKAQAFILNGAKAVQGAAFRSSQQGKLLAEVGKGAFQTTRDVSLLGDIAKGRFG